MSRTKIDLGHLVELNDDNYERWKYDIQLVLTSAGVWDVVSGKTAKPEASAADAYKAWDEKNNLAKTIIVTKVDKRNHNHVHGLYDAKDVWEKLAEVNSDSSPLNQQLTLQKYHAFQIRPDQPVVTACYEIEELARLLGDMGLKQEEPEIVTRIITALPRDKWAGFITSWGFVPKEQQTVSSLINALKREVSLHKDKKVFKEEKKSAAFSTQKGNGNFTKGKKFPGNQAEKRSCHFCGKVGHLKKDCRSLQKSQQGHSSQAHRGKHGEDGASRKGNESSAFIAHLNAFALPANQGQHQRRNVWYADSAASQHMCGSLAWYTNYEQFSAPRSVSLTDNTDVAADGTGTVRLLGKIGGVWKECTLHDVLYIPGAVNLFSEGTLAQRGYTIIRTGKETLFMQPDGRQGPEAYYSDGMYVMQFRPFNSTNACHVNASQLAHERLAHINMQYIKKAVKNDAVQGIAAKDLGQPFNCEDCHLGKETRKPYKRKERNEAVKPGELLHADLAGQFNASLGGAKYFLLIKDECTGFKIVCFLRRKSDAAEQIKDTIAFMERQTGNRVKAIRSDNGGEFVNTELDTFYKKKGIQQQLTCPYSPQSNGRAEREMRSIKEAARTLLQKVTDKRLWAEAVATAVYMQNRIPNKRSGNRSAYEQIFGHKPNLSHVRVFGSTAYAHIPGQRRGVWDATARRLILVGYGAAQHYRLYDPETHQIVIERNVSIQEPTRSFSPPIPFDDRDPDYDSSEDKDNEDTEEEEDTDDGEEHGEEEDEEDQDDEADQDDEEPGAEEEKGADFDDDSSSNGDGENPEGPSHIEPTSQQEGASGGASPSPQPGPSTAGERKDTPSKVKLLIKSFDGQNYEAEVAPNQPSNVKLPKTKKVVPPSSIELRKRDSLKKPDRYTPQPKANFTQLADPITEPKTYEEAITSPQAKEWIQAMRDEYQSLKDNGTFELIQKPMQAKVLDCKWVFKLKKHPDGSIERFKARLVVKGYLQQQGVDYDETFSSVCRYESIRLLWALAVNKGMHIKQFDVKTAFLYAKLKERVLVKQPKGLNNGNPMQVWRLIKSQYGLKQAPREWNGEITTFLEEECGLSPLPGDSCVFVGKYKGEDVYLIIWVDDGEIMAESREAIEELLERLRKKFQITVCDPKVFVGLELDYNREKRIMKIHQSGYIHSLLQKFGMEECKPSSTPMQPNASLLPAEVVDETLPYRSLVGALIFVAKCSRPDISYAVSKLAQHMHSYDTQHWKAAKGVLRYLRGTINFGLIYRGTADFTIYGYTDSDYAADKTDRKSQSGYAFMLGSSLVTWKSEKQPIVSLSTTEAEYISLATGVKEAVWLRQMMSDLNHPQMDATLILVDNQAAIRLAKNPEFHSRTKHIDVRFHFLRSLVDAMQIHVSYVPTDDQVADILTKALGKVKHEDMIEKIGLQDINQQEKNGNEEKSEDRHVGKGAKSTSCFSKPTKWLTLLALMCCLTPLSFSAELSRTPPLIWRKSNTPIIVGYHPVHLKIKFINPCELLSIRTVPLDLVLTARERCDQVYEKDFLDELETMCPKDHWSESTQVFDANIARAERDLEPQDILSRGKRVIELFALAVVQLVVTGLGIAGFGVATDANIRARNNKERIEILEKQVKLDKNQLRRIEARYNETVKNLKIFQADYDETKRKLIPTTYAISYVTTRILLGKEVIRQALREWREGKVSPALMDFLEVKLPCGQDCPFKLAKADKCRINHNRTEVQFLFTQPEVNNTLVLVEADPFKLMQRRQNETCTVKYTGPENAIISAKESCVYSVNVKKLQFNDFIISPSSQCRSKSVLPDGSKYFHIAMCQPRHNRDEWDYIQVKPHKTDFHIYCPNSTVTTAGKEQACPAYVFKLPMKANFKIADNEFQGTELNIVKKDDIDPLFELVADIHLQPHVDWNTLMLNDTDDLPNDLLQGPQDHHYFWLLMGCLGLVAVMLIAVIALSCSIFKMRNITVTAKTTDIELKELKDKKDDE